MEEFARLGVKVVTSGDVKLMQAPIVGRYGFFCDWARKHICVIKKVLHRT